MIYIYILSLCLYMLISMFIYVFICDVYTFIMFISKMYQFRSRVACHAFNGVSCTHGCLSYRYTIIHLNASQM